MTTQADIRTWLNRGLKDPKKPTHVLVVCDTFDHDDYPVYVSPNDNVREVARKYDGTNMQRLMEVYDLRKDLESQLNEHRSFNY